jgi:dTDP-glucose 4,6-dehydratase
MPSLEKAVCFLRENWPTIPTRPTVLLVKSVDHFVRAYGETYVYLIILNCSNNYGPNHYPEKLIRYLSRIFTGKAAPFMVMVNIPRLVICS